MPYRHEKEKHWEECRVEMAFSCVKYDLLNIHVTCSKSEVHVVGTSIITALSHLLNDTLLYVVWLHYDSQVRRMKTAVSIIMAVIAQLAMTVTCTMVPTITTDRYMHI